jgi:hypothetical protein
LLPITAGGIGTIQPNNFSVSRRVQRNNELAGDRLFS